MHCEFTQVPVSLFWEQALVQAPQLLVV